MGVGNFYRHDNDNVDGFMSGGLFATACFNSGRR